MVLNRLVDAGNSVTVIEHNLDVIKTADWIIDVGPDGGPKGGKVVAEGTPEQVAKVKNSETGRYLQPLLPKSKSKAKAKAKPTDKPTLKSATKTKTASTSKKKKASAA